MGMQRRRGRSLLKLGQESWRRRPARVMSWCKVPRRHMGRCNRTSKDVTNVHFDFFGDTTYCRVEALSHTNQSPTAPADLKCTMKPSMRIELPTILIHVPSYLGRPNAIHAFSNHAQCACLFLL